MLVVTARSDGDPQLIVQRRLLAAWRAGAADRDLSVVELVGDRAEGVADRAADLRRHLGLPAAHFAVALVGKDGHVALRADHPLPGATLQATIDAMPMRRAGQR